jgi:hypothetical protein
MEGADMSSARATAGDDRHGVTRNLPADDLETRHAALIENIVRGRFNVVEEARACMALKKELGLTNKELGTRVGRSTSGVGHLLRLMKLSEDLLGSIERGELGLAHGLALLVAKDPNARPELARTAVQERWSVSVLEDHAHESNTVVAVPDREGSAPSGRDVRSPRRRRNEDVSSSQQGRREREHKRDDDLAATGHAIAKAWGDVLSAEVQVNILYGRRLRVEVLLGSPEVALASARLLDEAISSGSRDSDPSPDTPDSNS